MHRAQKDIVLYLFIKVNIKINDFTLTINAKMMELVDMLGLGSSSFLKIMGSSPFFGKKFDSIWIRFICRRNVCLF